MELLVGKALGIALAYLAWRKFGWWALSVPIIGTGVALALTL